MKLYYSAGSCSTSCHITLEESGLPYQAIEIDWDNPSDPNLGIVERYNEMGTLPIMLVNDGTALNQNVAIHTHVADQVPAKNLLPKPGTLERAEAINWLSFVASDLHKSFSPMFGLEGITPNKEAQGQVRSWAVKNVQTCLDVLDKNLAGKEYLTGKNFTVADAYCFVVAGWTKFLNISTDAYPNLNAYMGRIYQRPAVQKVLKEEGLLQ